MSVIFSKYHGSQNDFLVIDDRDEIFPIDRQLIASLCHRKKGVGADGILLLQKSRVADCRMRIFNADGSEAAMCGNGLRCLVAFAREKGARCETVEVGGRVVRCSMEGEWITVDLGHYKWEREGERYLVDVGVPHAVVFVSDHQGVVEHVKEFSGHINLNFAVFKQDKLYNRTFERGVGETAACGSGAAAVAIAARDLYGMKNPVTVVPLSEEELKVVVYEDRVLLSGRAVSVFNGVSEEW